MASRGKLPGRRIGGAWRFARAEIHHWFEERIGVSDESGLLEVEQMLERIEPATESRETLICDLLPQKNLIIPLKGRTKNSVIDRVCQFASDLGLLWDPVKMADAIRARESMHPTALENGVALMHPRRPLSNLMAEPFLVLGRTVGGIPFGGPRGCLTDLFFLIASTDEAGHLRVLTRLSRLISDGELLNRIRDAHQAAEIWTLIRDAELEMDG
jgi:PTS system nitrogen regulatory IIA component